MQFLENVVDCVVAFVVGVVVGGLILYQHDNLHAQKEQTEAVQAARVEEHKAQDALQGVASDAETQRTQALGDAFIARAESERMRGELTAYVARSKASNSANPGGGKPGGDPLDLLANLFSESDERAGALAQYADGLRVSGQACVRSYNAVRAAYNAAP